MKNKKGLTLVELIAVIAVLGIVLGIAVVNVGRYMQKVEEKNKQNAIRMVLEAAREYYSKNHTMNKPGGGDITAIDLKNYGYVRFDDKYDNEEIFKNRVIDRNNCNGENEVRVYYQLKKSAGFDSGNYNDCGCEDQGGSETNGKEICEDTNGTYKN